MTRVRIAAKNPGRTKYVVACWNFVGSVSASSVPQRAFCRVPSSGSGRAAVADSTPGIAARRTRRSRMNALRASRLGQAEIRDQEGQHAACLVPRLHPLQRNEAPDHQAGSDQQHERQRDLERRRSGCGASLRTRARRFGRTCAARPCTSGREARTAGTSPKTIADTSAAPAANAITAGSIATCCRRGRLSGPSAISSRMPVHASPHAGDRRRRGEHQALREQLAHEARPRAAERRPHRQLALARGRAHEQQVRHVRARDEQHERDGAHERQDRGPHVGDEILVHRLDADVHAGGLLDGELRAQVRRHRLDLVLRPARETPGLRRAITRRKTLMREPAAKSTRSGVHRSGARATFVPGGNRSSNPGSSTPITSNGRSPRRTTVPTIAALPPKRRCQNS